MRNYNWEDPTQIRGEKKSDSCATRENECDNRKKKKHSREEFDGHREIDGSRRGSDSENESEIATVSH